MRFKAENFELHAVCRKAFCSENFYESYLLRGFLFCKKWLYKMRIKICNRIQLCVIFPSEAKKVVVLYTRNKQKTIQKGVVLDKRNMVGVFIYLINDEYSNFALNA